MLKEIFKPYVSSIIDKKTFILVDIGDEDPCRGDSHGFIGMARRVAEKMGGTMVCIDGPGLEIEYPEITESYRGSSHNLRLKQYFRDHGYPDIFFSRFTGDQHDMKEHGTGLIVRAINENLSTIVRRERDLVSHHLNPDTLKFEGEKFAQEYSEMPRPFIALMMAADTDILYTAADIPKLVSIADAYGECTIFICTGHKTSSYHFNRVMAEIKRQIGLLGIPQKIHVVGYDYNYQAEIHGVNNHYNMYAGLIDQADHIIVSGASRSMISEPLASGKVPFTMLNRTYNELCDQGLVSRFSDCTAGEPLKTKHIKPVNVTEDVADYIIKNYRFNTTANPFIMLKRAIIFGLEKCRNGDTDHGLVIS